MTEKQKIFVDEYLVDLNATRAYKAAYMNIKSDDTAAAAGARLLRNVKVEAYVTKRMKEREKRTEITQDRVLQELALIAYANATDYAKIVEYQAYEEKGGVKIPMFDANGYPVMYRTVELQLTDELTDEQQRALATVKRGRDGALEAKPCDKVKALELLGKHLGMFTDKLDMTGDISLTVEYDYGENE